MKSLNTFITEKFDIDKLLSDIEKQDEDRKQQPGESDEEYQARIDMYISANQQEAEKKNEKLKSRWINLPYSTELFNKGSKNVDFKITINTINNIRYNTTHPSIKVKKVADKSWEIKTIENKERHITGIIMELPADEIYYKGDSKFYNALSENPDYNNLKKITNDFNDLPEIQSTQMVIPYWGPNDPATKEIVKILNSYSKYFKSGKLPVTFTDAPQGYDREYIYMKVTDKDFIKDREEKIKRLEDPQLLKDLESGYKKDLQRQQEKAEQERLKAEKEQKEREAAIKKAKEEAEAERNELVQKLKDEGASDEDIKKALYDLYRTKEYERMEKQNNGFTND